MTLADSLRASPRVMRGDYTYIVHPLLDGVPRVPADMLAEARDRMLALPVWDDVNLVVAPEAMALPLAAAITLHNGVPYVVARKREYGLHGERIVRTETGYGSSTMHLNDVRPGERVVVVDDVLSTGGTLDALLSTLHDADAVVVAALIVVDKGDARKRLEKRHGVPIHVLETIRV